MADSCNVTNNSGKDVTILWAESYYEKTLTQMKLGSGGTLLKAGSTDTIVLDGTCVHNGQTTPENRYLLIFVDPRSLSPVTLHGIMRNFSTGLFPDVTISAADATNMTSALNFSQTINAFPNSKLAQKFTTALKSADGKSIEDTETIMNQFFQGTGSFKTVVFPLYLTASSYISNFLPWWYPPATKVPYNTDHAIPPHTEYSYWIYSSANMGGGSNGATKASALGRVMFLNPPTGDPSDHNCGIKVYFTTDAYALPSATGTQLYFDNGQLVDQLDDAPQYCLQGLWASQSIFTGTVTDTTLWPTLVGTINGTKVIGVPYRPEDGWDKFCSFWSGLTFDKVLNLFLTVMGVVMAIDFIRSKFASKETKTAEVEANQNQGEPLTPEQEAQVELEAQADGKAAETTANADAARMGTDPATGQPNLQVPTEETLPSTQANIAQAQTEANNSVQGDSMEVTLNNYNDVLTDLSQYPDDENNDLSYADGELKAAKDKLPDAVETGDFTEVQTHVNNIEPSIDTWQQATGQSLDSDASQGIEDAKTSIQDFEDLQEQNEEASEGADGGDPSTEDGFTPEIPEV